MEFDNNIQLPLLTRYLKWGGNIGFGKIVINTSCRNCRPLKEIVRHFKAFADQTIEFIEQCLIFQYKKLSVILIFFYFTLQLSC
jgi:hypothetical protein